MNQTSLKVGDVFLGELREDEWVTFTIVVLDDNLVGYVVQNRTDTIYRDHGIWNHWVKDGEMLPCTELIKALL
jgi:hypothetical protein